MRLLLMKKKILTLPFSNHGEGPTLARNWCWEHSISLDAKKHWVLDDNINGFVRLNHNERIVVKSGTIFKVAEDFIDRYENVAISGFEYRFFAGGARRKKPPYRLNTRVYSCMLIRNDIPYRWEGKYNEDTDICLRALKDGWCTVLFYAFIQQKAQSLTMSGGNDEIYSETDNRKEFAESLQRQHPDVVDVTWKFNRWHHQVNYKPFRKNRLVRKEGLNVKKGINNYGMVLKDYGRKAELS